MPSQTCLLFAYGQIPVSWLGDAGGNGSSAVEAACSHANVLSSSRLHMYGVRRQHQDGALSEAVDADEATRGAISLPLKNVSEREGRGTACFSRFTGC